MHLDYNYWFFKSALSPNVCDEIIATGKKYKSKKAVTGNAKKASSEVQKLRKSNVAWLNDRWIYNHIHPYVHTANKNAGWNYQWDWSESCQFTKYSKGQFYGWHCDSWAKPYAGNDSNRNGKIRKLSVTVSLSDPKDYEGGELEFKSIDGHTGKLRNTTCKEILPRGSIVVFPSHIWHRVKPVKEGTRYSLVVWNLGWPFK